MNHINAADLRGNVHGLPHIPENLNPELPAVVQTLKNGVHKSLDFIRYNVSQRTLENGKNFGFATTIIWLATEATSSPNIFTLSLLERAQLFLTPIAAGLAIGCCVALAGATVEVAEAVIMKLQSSPRIEVTDLTALSDEEFQEALRSGKIPNAFQDPISYEIIDDPVTYSEDPSKRAFDRESIAEWEKRRGRHALHPTLFAPFSKLTSASMPLLKAQIGEFKAKWGHHLD